MISYVGTGFAHVLPRAALALSKSLTTEEEAQGFLYPDLARIRDVSVIVAMDVIRAAEDARVARETHIKTLNAEALEKWVRSKMYEPYAETGRNEAQVRDLLKE